MMVFTDSFVIYQVSTRNLNSLFFCIISAKMSLTPRDIVTKLNAWYNKDNKLMFEEQTFYSVGKQLLGAHLQCAKTKLNQIVFCK